MNELDTLTQFGLGAMALSLVGIVIASIAGIRYWLRWRREEPAIWYDPSVIHGPMEEPHGVTIQIVNTAQIPVISPSAHGDTPLTISKVAKVRGRALQSRTR